MSEAKNLDIQNIPVTKVAVGLSGGVDSSVAAFLLKDQGYDVVGVHMKCWDYKTSGCSGDQDKIDAIRVANKLDIGFEFLDFQKEYRQKVIDIFFADYKAGNTPNPDILCNREIKFGLFMDWALRNGFSHVATGHYANVIANSDGFHLFAGADKSKDQSYFLYVLGQEELARTIFPLGYMKKENVRKIAKEQGFFNHDKPDSVGICFIGEVDIKEFLQKEIESKQGDVVNTKGEVIGKHDGVSFYTIGQRHGFEIDKYIGLPVYVVEKKVKENQLVVGFYDEAKRDKFIVHDVHFVNKVYDKSFECDVRIRHLGELYSSKVEVLKKADNKLVGLEVHLSERVFGVAPGQHAVFYLNEEVIGGGEIAV